MGAIRKIVIHCSDSPDNLDIGVKEIRTWHTSPKPQGRGWREVGYHYVVRRDGSVEVGRYENGDSVLEGEEIGAHARGHNADSLAVCWVGRDRPTSSQRSSLLRLVAHLTRQHGVPVGLVLGHKELDAGKTCPNLDMDEIRKAVAAVLVSSAA